jgi:SAM-dependent MidA family methyltransferase
MDLSLYCPEYGFYEKESDRIGRRGDYFTSVSVGAVFGELLAFQFAEWIETGRAEKGGAKAEQRAQVIESGGHDGRLARDILGWFRRERPELFSRIEYFLIEPSPLRRQWQRETLADFTKKITWVSDLGSLPASNDDYRVMFSNELLDAMPVHRLGWDARENRWFEWGVTVRDSKFVWAPMIAPKTEPIWRDQVSRIVHYGLPDGFVLECCPAADRWWDSAARALGRGKLLALDYGLTTHDLLAPERKNGTLRGYRGHQISSDVLASPGEQDLTAHVNFTSLQTIGEAAGLRTECMLTQEAFLMPILEKVLNHPVQTCVWTESQKRQLMTLTHPSFMGRQFRVLMQGRG